LKNSSTTKEIPSNEKKVDREQVSAPRIEFTPRALEQIELIIKNDFTLKGRYFRILISGKGCDGFTYSTGFTEFHDEDFMVKIENKKNLDFSVLIDPFASFYLQETVVDFIQDYEKDLEGFVVENKNQNQFSGKFWRESPTDTPPLVTV
jgi:iron-sulfur cluster insertion protein